jgi:hypothetical protein
MYCYILCYMPAAPHGRRVVISARVGVTRIGVFCEADPASFFDTLIIAASRILCHGITHYHSLTRPSLW